MASLENKLQEWCNAGVIDSAAVDRIRAHEEQQAGARSGWALFGIVGLGVVVLMTGIISALAANWGVIPPSLKLGGYFAVQLALGIASYRFIASPLRVTREAILTLNGFFVLAGIGLIAQIYNLSGDGWSALLLWLSLIFPLTYLVQTRLLGECWVIGFISMVSMWCFAHLQYYEHDPLVLGAGLLCICFAWISAWNVRDALFLPQRLVGAAHRCAFGALLLVVTPIANGIHYSDQPLPAEVSSGLALTMLIVGATLTILSAYLARPALGRGTQISYALFFTLFALSLIIPIELPEMRSKVFGCAIFVLTWGSAAAIAANVGHKRYFDLATLVIAIRFIVVYFEVFGSLLATGFGLICAGLVILGISYLWHRYRSVISQFLVGA